MAVNLDIRSLQSVALSAQHDRLVNRVVTAGVWDTGHFQVVEQAAPNMTVRVGSGTPGDIAVVEGSGTLQGRYLVQNVDAYAGNAATDLTIAEGDPTDPRIDRIVLRVYEDAYDSSGQNTPALEVVQGTPAASPSAPATPDSSIVLAEILVAAGESTSIVNGDITDVQEVAKFRGQLVETVTFTASGTFSKADYPWLRTVRITTVGAGGGGGGAGAVGAGEGRVGSGGGGGQYRQGIVAAGDLSASETVTVGGGGSGGAGGTNGTAGGSTSFGSHLSASGGSFGRAGATGSGWGGVALGGSGGSGGSGGDWSVDGTAGGDGVRNGGDVAFPGTGGGSTLHTGTSAQPVSSGSNTSGDAGTSGSGGGGGANTGGGITSGGAGGDGIVIVDLFA